MGHNVALVSALEVSSPPDVHYYYGSIGNTITWTIEYGPLPAGTYRVYRNNTEIGFGHSTVVTINIDGLDIGVYDYTIQVSTYHGDSSHSDTVIVTIDYHHNPIIQFLIEYQFIMVGIGLSLFAIISLIAILQKKRK